MRHSQFSVVLPASSGRCPNAGPVMAAVRGTVSVNFRWRSTVLGKMETRPILGREWKVNMPTATHFKEAITGG